MRNTTIAVALCLLACACTTPAPERAPAATRPPLTDITPFSRNAAGAALPLGWQGLVISRAKDQTRYDTVFDPFAQRVVLRARSDRACTGLRQRLDVDPRARPRVAWEWRVVQLVEGADNTRRETEDSPVRLMLFFDGDREALAVRDRITFDLAQLASGEPLPFATLMYIWENNQAVGTFLDSPFTGQVKMIVAGSGERMLGDWKRFERNYVEDYRRAFGHPPGRLIGVGVLTDSDNTGTSVEAFYGDIRLLSSLP